MTTWRWLACLIASATAAVAADTPASGGQASLDAAKRDLDAIKAAKSPTGVPSTGTLPAIAAPELHLPGATPATPSALSKRERLTREQIEAERKAKNWLVEAVAKEKRLDDAARDGRKESIELESERTLSARDALRAGELDLHPDDPAAIAMREAEAATKDEIKSREPESRSTSAINPLSSYMAAWMTPQDLALLQPGLATGQAAAGVVPTETIGATAAGSVAAASVSSSVSDGMTSMFTDKPGRTTAPAENPYLQPLLPPSQLEAVFAPPPPAAVSAPASSPIFAPPPPPRAEIEAPRSKVPDFARPSDNDKYFKQLKRF